MTTRRDLVGAGKLALVETARLAPIFLGVYALGHWLPLVPWKVALGVWIAGMAAAHVWMSRGMVGGLTLGDYARDSGIPLVVILWPAFAIMIFGPMYAQAKAAKILGVRWNDEGKPIV